MPTNYNTPRTTADPNSAISRASQEVVKNGFGTVLPNNLPLTYFGCPNSPSTFEVAVCPVTGFASNLRVTITEHLNVVLLGALGVQPITLQASGQAEFLSPIQIGARANYFGDETECSGGNSQNTNTAYCDPSASGNHLNNFFATMDGPAELKEAGDPMVYCEEGKSTIASASDLGQPPPQPSAYNGYPTNHQQWQLTGPITSHCGDPVAGGNPGNPDNQPTGYDGEATRGTTAHPGGYNYEISVAPGLSASLWIYNPTFAPHKDCIPSSTNPSCQYRPLDHFIDNNDFTHFQGPRGEGIPVVDLMHYDAPLLYFKTTISLYTVNSQYDPRYSVVPGFPPLIYDPTQTSQRITFQPYDAIPEDLTAHGCSTATIPGGGIMADRPAQVYDPLWNGADTANTYHNPGSIVPGGCVDTTGLNVNFSTTCILQWCKISPSGGLTEGLYRLVIEATGLDAATSDYTSSALDGWGQHAYSLKLCDNAAATDPYSCGSGSNATGAGQYNTAPLAIFGWNNSDVVYQDLLATRSPNKNFPQSACVDDNSNPYACLDLACIPSVYAGRDVTARIFNLGSSPDNGEVYIAVVPPAGSTATVSPLPAYIPLVPGGIDGNSQTVRARDPTGSPPFRVFTGLWIDFKLHLPSNYSVDCRSTGTGTGWWQLMFASDNVVPPQVLVTPNDKVGIEFILTGSPVHLVPPTFL
jgi:hypothetical protein